MSPHGPSSVMNFLVFVLILISPTFSAPQGDREVLDFCTSQGRKWAETDRPRPCNFELAAKSPSFLNLDVTRIKSTNELRNCEHLFSTVCEAAMRLRLCKVGVDLARRSDTPDSCSTPYQLDGEKTIEKCCLSCSNGHNMALSEGKCTKMASLDELYTNAMMVCCKKALQKTENQSFIAPTQPSFDEKDTAQVSNSTSNFSSDVTTPLKISETTTKLAPSPTSVTPDSITELPIVASISTPTVSTPETSSEPIPIPKESNIQDEVPKSLFIDDDTDSSPSPTPKTTTSNSISTFLGSKILQENERECRYIEEFDTNGTTVMSPDALISKKVICLCDNGYEAHEKSEIESVCKDIDECITGNHNCVDYNSCVNTLGGFVCNACKKGQLLEDGQCTEVDSRETDRSIPSYGGMVQECKKGFKRDVKTQMCHDIDECDSEFSPCFNFEECVNVKGSYVCHKSDCEFEYALPDGTCADLECPLGYVFDRFDKGCVDIDECVFMNDTCKSPKVCKNLPGTFVCECPVGFEWNENQNKCEDIKECSAEKDVCDISRSFCRELEGSFECSCKKGYKKLSQFGQCEDIDECKEENTCTEGQKCFNFDGGFECGVEGEDFRDFLKSIQPDAMPIRDSSSLQCPDATNCSGRNCFKLKCDMAFYCVHNSDEYSCRLKKCLSSKTLNREGNCVAKSNQARSTEEYIQQTSTQTPQPTIASDSFDVTSPKTETPHEEVREILCPKGYSLNGTDCEDVNECLMSSHSCEDPDFCQNTNGAYECVKCPIGFVIDPSETNGPCKCSPTKCEQIQNRHCSPEEKVSQEQTCQCKPDFASIDEECVPYCKVGKDKVFDCECPFGFQKKFDRCLKLCDSDQDCNGSECARHDGVKMCACPRGFSLDHKKEKCVDIDECSEKNVCGKDKECLNFVGSFKCVEVKCDEGLNPSKGGCFSKDQRRFVRMKNIVVDKEKKGSIIFVLPQVFGEYKLGEVLMNPKTSPKVLSTEIVKDDITNYYKIVLSLKDIDSEEWKEMSLNVTAHSTKKDFQYEARINLYIIRDSAEVEMIGHE